MLDNHRLPASRSGSGMVDPARLGRLIRAGAALEETIGQERAVEALEFGLQMKSPGFNIFVSGPVGTGKGTLVRQMVQRLAPDRSRPHRIGVLSIISRTPAPVLPFVFSGTRRVLQTRYEHLHRRSPPGHSYDLEGKKYLDAKAKIIEETEDKKKNLFHDLTILCHQRGFVFEETAGFAPFPIKDDRPNDWEGNGGAPESIQEELTARRHRWRATSGSFHVRMHGLEREAEQALHHLTTRSSPTS